MSTVQDGDQGGLAVARPPRRSKPPSKGVTRAWIVVFSALGLGAVGAHLYGLQGLMAFQAKRNRWEAEISQHKAIRSEWQQLNAELEAEVDAARKTKSEAEAEKTVRVAELDDLRSAVRKLSKELELLRAARDAAVQEQTRAFSEHTRHTEGVAAAKKTLAGLRKDQAQVLESLDTLRAGRARAEKSSISTKALLQRRLSELKQANGELEVLSTREAKNLERVQKIQDDWRTTWTRERDSLAKAQQAEARLARVKSDSVKINAELVSLQSAKAKLEAELRTLGTNRDEDEMAATKAKLALEPLQRKIGQYERSLPKVRGQYSATREILKTAKAELAAVRTQLDETKPLALEVSKKQEQLRILQARVNRVRAEERSLLDHLAKLRKSQDQESESKEEGK